jgi:hypothetical protein
LTLAPSPELLAAAGIDPASVVVVSPRSVDGWEAARAALIEAFASTRDAAIAGLPVVVIVHGDDLLGRRGAPRAMVACGLLSGTRTAAIEGRKPGIPVNLIAVEDDTPPETVAAWVARLAEPGGPSGEVVHLGTTHLGKALA